MPPVKLVCDSTADLDPEFAKRHGVSVVPLRVIFGEDEFRDFVDMHPAQFFARMQTDTTHPRTSQPSPAEFEAAFRAAGTDGSAIVCTTISCDLSGTMSSAMQAKAALPEMDIRIFDTRTLGPGHNAMLSEAVAAHEAGAGADEILEILATVRDSQKLLFTVESLEYLRRGGRIGGAQAFLGNVLSIKPILEISEGKVDALDRVRTFPKAVGRILEEVERSCDEWGGAQVTVAHAGCAERGAEIAGRVQAITGKTPELIEVGPVIGCHGGPGAVGLAFHKPVRAH